MYQHRRRVRAMVHMRAKKRAAQMADKMSSVSANRWSRYILWKETVKKMIGGSREELEDDEYVAWKPRWRMGKQRNKKFETSFF